MVVATRNPVIDDHRQKQEVDVLDYIGLRVVESIFLTVFVYMGGTSGVACT